MTLSNNAVKISISGPHPSPLIVGSLVFGKIQDALDYVTAHNIFSAEINIDIGVYPDPFTIPQNTHLIFKGSISGLCVLGDVTYNVSGSYMIGSGSAVSFNDLTINSVIIKDGYPVATNAILVFQNCTILGSLNSLGSSMTTIFFAGIGGANSGLTGSVESNQIIGNVQATLCPISATNTVFDGYVNCEQIYASGCDFNGNITTSSNGLELHNSLLAANTSLSSSNLQVDDFANYQIATKNITVSAQPLILAASPSWKRYHFDHTQLAAPSPTAGVLIYVLKPKEVVEKVIIKSSIAVTSVSGLLTYSLAIAPASKSVFYITAYDAVAAVSDTNFGSATNAKPLSFASTNNLMLTATTKNGNTNAALTGAWDVWIQTSQMR